MPKHLTMTANMSGRTRYSEIDGVKYLVAPMTMMVEGVHNGSGGPLLYLRDDLRNSVQAWNHMPIVLYHPTRNGQGVSARDPDILNQRGLGLVLNASYVEDDNELRAEAWFNVTKVEAVAPDIIKNLEAEKPTELSTGLSGVIENKEGKFGEGDDAVDYVGIVRNHSPDHLAILPGSRGACSNDAGCGLLVNCAGNCGCGCEDEESLKKKNRLLNKYLEKVSVTTAPPVLITNERSHSNIFEDLWQAVRQAFGEAWIEDVFDTFVIVAHEGKLYKLGYTLDDTTATLADVSTKSEVRRVTEYRTVDGTFVGNAASFNTETEVDMSRKTAVDNLINNGGSGEWKEDDRSFLMEVPENQFVKIVANNDLEVVEEDSDDDPEPTPAPAGQVTNQNGGQMTLGQFMAGAPPEVAQLLNNALQQNAATADTLRKQIVANSNGVYTEEDLKGMDVAGLQKIAQLCNNSNSQYQTANFPIMQPNYAGAAGGFPGMIGNTEGDEEVKPLVTNQLDWGDGGKSE